MNTMKMTPPGKTFSGEVVRGPVYHCPMGKHSAYFSIRVASGYVHRVEAFGDAAVAARSLTSGSKVKLSGGIKTVSAGPGFEPAQWSYIVASSVLPL